jgi:hypothetical protein
MDYKYRYRYRGIFAIPIPNTVPTFHFSHTKRVLAQHQLIVGLGLGLGLSLEALGLGLMASWPRPRSRSRPRTSGLVNIPVFDPLNPSNPFCYHFRFDHN